MNGKILYKKALTTLWEKDITSGNNLEVRLINGLRITYAVVRDAVEGQLTLRAMSLVYTTLLSLVPLLAVSFSVLKAFGVHNQIEPLLLGFLQPLGEKSIEITERIVSFVENMKAGVLGSLGLVLLLYTVVSLIQKIERSFNFVWRVKSHRSFTKRFSDYLSVVIVGPILIFTAIGITASITNASIVQQISSIQPFGEIIRFTARMIPYVLIILAFTFVYVLIPNTKVKIGSALIGAISSGILWETMGWTFASFVANSVKYTAIYSAFATLIMFMIWLYLAWLILLIGTSIAFYHQHPEYLALDRRELKLSNRMKENIVLQTMYLIGKDFHERGLGWSTDKLAKHLHLPMEIMEDIISMLINSKLIVRTCDNEAVCHPSQSIDNILVEDILNAARNFGEEAGLSMSQLPKNPVIEQLAEQIHASARSAINTRTLKDLVLTQTG